MTYSREDLTPVCLQLFEAVKSELPEDTAGRLVCSRAVRNHGSYRTVLLFNVWDKYQSDVLPKQHFCYCLGYDPHQLISGSTDWYFHLWLNTVRLYRDRIAVKQRLENSIEKACPKGFRFYTDDRSLQAKINFTWKNGLAGFVNFLRPKYVQLISTVHPVLMPIIDRYSIYGRPEVKAEVASRGRIPVAPVRTTRPDLIEEYSRSIPPAWRAEILKEHDHKCAHCGEALKGGEYHMDHIIPFSKGGKRVKSNFQPLCPACNLSKGNRFIG